MRRITARTLCLLVLIVPFLAGLGILVVQFTVHGGKWAADRTNQHIYTKGQPSATGAILDRNGVALRSTKNGKMVWPSSSDLRRATLHAAGDVDGIIGTGAQHAFADTLSGYNRIQGLFSTIKYGRGSNVTLSIDAELCKSAYRALNGRKGTVGVYNYKTGEVLCMVSAPAFDPKNKPAFTEKQLAKGGAYEAVYLNRFLNGLYTPGSVFKVVTGAAAIENIPDLGSRTFHCEGKFATGEGWVTCSGKHGDLSFEEGFNVSCNVVFATLALELGEETLRTYAQDMGFNKTLHADGIVLATSKFPKKDPEKPLSRIELGWTGIGQGTVLANPAQMLTLMGAIANNGNGIAPRLTLSTETPSGLVIPSLLSATPIKIRIDTAAQLKTYLHSNVLNYYDKSGTNRDLGLCGKTGTAEVEDGKPHAWFVGFSQNLATPYAVVVTVEHGGSGKDNAYPIAVKMLRELK
ncbi:MAG: penicillin-binding protein [Oscillospiraceae bacterium]|jgi:peptidoglycan glycosyltransferase|nr:penicillin-binding protein [Oscillospiraceae bacterium]